MKLSTKGRYALIALVDLAQESKGGLVSLGEISERQNISLAYLEQLFVKLRRSGVVQSVRGPGGGYRLGRSSETVFIAEIIDAVNESVDSTNCQGKGDCQGGEICLTHSLWDQLSHEIHNFLNAISLADLVARRDVKSIAQRQVEQLLILNESPQASAC